MCMHDKHVWDVLNAVAMRPSMCVLTCYDTRVPCRHVGMFVCPPPCIGRSIASLLLFISIMTASSPLWTPASLPLDRAPSDPDILRDHYLCAWYDLMNNYLEGASSGLRVRLGRSMQEWMMYANQESDMYYRW